MAEGWGSCDATLRGWVSEACRALEEELAPHHVGTYLHGSLASGSFHPPKSDVDVLFVAEAPLDPDARRCFATSAALVNRERPITGSLECSVVLREVVGRPVHPMPVEVQFSEDRTDDILAGRTDWQVDRTDPDLAAHVQAICEFGVALSGPPVSEVFSPLPRAAFVDSIRGDLDWIVDGENILESPYYGVLNLARILWVFERATDRLVPSKDEAGEWLLGVAPAEHRAVVEHALAAYRDGAVVPPDERRTAGGPWPKEPLLRFRDWARERAERADASAGWISWPKPPGAVGFGPARPAVPGPAEALIETNGDHLMNEQSLNAMWDLVRNKYGVYLRVLDAIPADRFHDHPVPDMRTPAQMVVHTSGSIVRDIAEGVASGAIEADEADEEEVAARLESKDDVLAFARECWARADAAVQKVGDDELAGEVGNPWGMPLNGTFAMVILNDEFLHHRGQLYAYVRACGAEPPFMWGFEDNPPDFQPRG